MWDQTWTGKGTKLTLVSITLGFSRHWEGGEHLLEKLLIWRGNDGGTIGGKEDLTILEGMPDSVDK